MEAAGEEGSEGGRGREEGTQGGREWEGGRESQTSSSEVFLASFSATKQICEMRASFAPTCFKACVSATTNARRSTD